MNPHAPGQAGFCLDKGSNHLAEVKGLQTQLGRDGGKGQQPHSVAGCNHLKGTGQQTLVEGPTRQQGT
jgi:hypothetical protein